MVEEKKAIETWISRLGDAGILLRLSYLRQLAASIIQQRTPHESEVKIGEHWVARFLDRHPDPPIDIPHKSIMSGLPLDSIHPSGARSWRFFSMSQPLAPKMLNV